MILPSDGIICDAYGDVSCRSYNVSTLRVPPPWVPERSIAMITRMKETIHSLSIPRPALCASRPCPGVLPPRHGRNGRGPLSSEPSHKDGKFPSLSTEYSTRRIAPGAGNRSVESRKFWINCGDRSTPVANIGPGHLRRTSLTGRTNSP